MLCICMWAILPLVIPMIPSLMSFRSLSKCHLLGEASLVSPSKMVNPASSHICCIFFSLAPITIINLVYCLYH